MRYVIFLKNVDGDTTTLTEFGDDPESTCSAERELLLLLGPYSPLVGNGQWIGARVTVGAMPNKHLSINQWQSDSQLQQYPANALLEEAQRHLASRFSEFHTICNFTKGEYIVSSEPFVKWLDNPLGPGLQLLHLLAHPDKSLNWSGCEIAITPLFFPWMKDVTQASRPAITWQARNVGQTEKAVTHQE